MLVLFPAAYHVFQIDKGVVNCHHLALWLLQGGTKDKTPDATKSKSFTLSRLQYARTR